jgi:hypothetical protein
VRLLLLELLQHQPAHLVVARPERTVHGLGRGREGVRVRGGGVVYFVDCWRGFIG